MTLEASSTLFAYTSLICSLSFWLDVILSYFHRAFWISLAGGHWLAILGAGVVLAVVAAVFNFEKRLWIFSFVLALVTFFFVMYVTGS